MYILFIFVYTSCWVRWRIAEQIILVAHGMVKVVLLQSIRLNRWRQVVRM